MLFSRILRKIAKYLSKLRLDRFVFLINIYRSVVSYFIPKGTRILSVNGYKMAITMIRADNFGDTGISLILDGVYEPQVTRYFKQFVKSGMNVVDVGANIGYYTLLASKIVGDKGEVWAFEPNTANYGDLVHNISLNDYKNIQTIQKAVGDKDGKARLNLSKDCGGHSLIIDYNNGYLDVDVIKLDSVITGRVDIIKSDTEGNEIAVLSGAKRLLDENKDIKLFFEFLGAFGMGYVNNLIRALNSYGFVHLYNMSAPLNGKLERVTSEDFKITNPRYAPNILCSRSELNV